MKARARPKVHPHHGRTSGRSPGGRGSSSIHPCRKTPALLALALALGLSSSGCATNPATGETQLSIIGERQEIEIGRQAHQDVVASVGLYDDPRLQEYVQFVGDSLAARSERPDLPWTFRVVDDPSVNAFALPGGFVYVTRGMLAYLSSEAGLAAVLGHEIGHVTARHAVERISKAQLANLGLGLGMILEPDLARFGDLASFGLQLLFLKYSRDDERQADDLGLRYVIRRAYDPRSMLGVFTTLDRVSRLENAGRLPDWLSSHPNPEDRRERIAQEIEATRLQFEFAKVERDPYLRRMDKIVFGMNPREGFFRGQTLLHPDLEFRMDFPRGWSAVNRKQQVAAVSPRKEAIIGLTLTEETSAESAARAFARQPALRAGGFRRRTVNGLPAVWSGFEAVRQNVRLCGLVVFVGHGGRVYQLIGYSPCGRWPAYEEAIAVSAASFAPLDDPDVLAVEPLRLEVLELPRPMTPPELAASYASPVSAEVLAILNQVEVGEPLPSSQPVKRVVGKPLKEQVRGLEGTRPTAPP